jgi:hypothetical protein
MTWYEPAEGQAEMIASGTALAGAFYTLMLGAIYLPCALVLSRRAQDLARHAVASGAGETPDGWLESNDLQVSWRGNTGRILAVVSPMLTAVVPAWSSLLGG